ncbi:AP complex subunit sigma [Aphelenchoides besseyi]|nr:AP complex subunit sigma [Aphelenchoides besseyi]
MRKLRPTVTIENLPKKAVYSDSSIHILPTSLDYTGPAEVSTYLRQEHGWTTFRGQPLQKTTIKAPSGFSIFTVAEKQTQKVALDVVQRNFIVHSLRHASFTYPFKMMEYMLLFSRQGKLRLQKWYLARTDKQKKKITRDLITAILARKPKMCAFLEYGEKKVVYKRLVCELDIIFNFEKAYFILDEFLLAGEVQETSKKQVLKAISAQDLLQDDETTQGFFEDNGLG